MAEQVKGAEQKKDVTAADSGKQRSRRKPRTTAAQKPDTYQESASDTGKSVSDTSAELVVEAALDVSDPDAAISGESEQSAQPRKGSKRRRERGSWAAAAPPRPARETRHGGKDAPGKYTELDIESEEESESASGTCPLTQSGQLATW